MTLPLYQGGLAGAQVRQAQAQQNIAIEQGVDTERQVIANTRGAFAAYQASAAAITANQQAVSANELALEGVRAENRVGTRTVLDVLNAEQELLNSQVQLVSAEHDEYVAGFALLNAMGMAEARDLGLDGGSLYDPTANYNRVKGWIGDWSEQPKYTAKGTRTNGPTPVDPDVAPYDPDAHPNGAVTAPQQ
jgi:outer membrane protein